MSLTQVERGSKGVAVEPVSCLGFSVQLGGEGGDT